MRNLCDDCKKCLDNNWGLDMCMECCGVPVGILDKIEEIRNRKKNKAINDGNRVHNEGDISIIAEIHIYDGNKEKELVQPFDIKPSNEMHISVLDTQCGYTKHYFNFMITSVDKEMKLNMAKLYDKVVKEFLDEPDNAH
jgi:hypothetical protein